MPGTKEDLAPAGIPGAARNTVPSSAEQLMPPSEATKYRGIAARLNFLAQDRIDLQYACKDASRRMSKP